jgi:hypothetical protein
VKKIELLLIAATILLFIFTMICGLWIRFQAIIEAGDLNFHMFLSVLTGIFTIATFLRLVIRLEKYQPKKFCVRN